MNKKMIFIVLFLVGGLMQEARGTSEAIAGAGAGVDAGGAQRGEAPAREVLTTTPERIRSLHELLQNPITDKTTKDLIILLSETNDHLWAHFLVSKTKLNYRLDKLYASLHPETEKELRDMIQRIMLHPIMLGAKIVSSSKVSPEFHETPINIIIDTCALFNLKTSNILARIQRLRSIKNEGAPEAWVQLIDEKYEDPGNLKDAICDYILHYDVTVSGNEMIKPFCLGKMFDFLSDTDQTIYKKIKSIANEPANYSYSELILKKRCIQNLCFFLAKDLSKQPLLKEARKRVATKIQQLAPKTLFTEPALAMCLMDDNYDLLTEIQRSATQNIDQSELIAKITSLLNNHQYPLQFKSDKLAPWALTYLTQECVLQAHDITRIFDFLSALNLRRHALLDLIKAIRPHLNDTAHSTALDTAQASIEKYQIPAEPPTTLKTLAICLLSLPKKSKELSSYEPHGFVDTELPSHIAQSFVFSYPSFQKIADEWTASGADALTEEEKSAVKETVKKIVDTICKGATDGIDCSMLPPELQTDSVEAAHKKWTDTQAQKRATESERQRIEAWRLADLGKHSDSPLTLLELTVSDSEDVRKKRAKMTHLLEQATASELTASPSIFRAIQAASENNSRKCRQLLFDPQDASEASLQRTADNAEAFLLYLQNQGRTDYGLRSHGKDFLNNPLTERLIAAPLTNLKKAAQDIIDAGGGSLNEDFKQTLLERLSKLKQIVPAHHLQGMSVDTLTTLYTLLESIIQNTNETALPKKKLAAAVKKIMEEKKIYSLFVIKSWLENANFTEAIDTFFQQQLSPETIDFLFSTITDLKRNSIIYSDEHNLSWLHPYLDTVVVPKYIIQQLFGLAASTRDETLDEEYQSRASQFKEFLARATTTTDGAVQSLFDEEIKAVLALVPEKASEEEEEEEDADASTDTPPLRKTSSGTTLPATPPAAQPIIHNRPAAADTPKPAHSNNTLVPAKQQQATETPEQKTAENNHLVTGGIAVSTGLAAGSAVSLLAHLILKNGPTLLRNHYNLLLAERASLEADNQDTTAIDKKLAAVNKQLIALKGRNKKITAGAGIATGTAAALLALLYQHNHGNN